MHITKIERETVNKYGNVTIKADKVEVSVQFQTVGGAKDRGLRIQGVKTPSGCVYDAAISDVISMLEFLKLEFINNPSKFLM